MIKQLPRNRKRLASGIAANIRQEIEAGNREPGASLPTARELASFYRVSQVTANRALEALASEGMIYRVKGQGSFVAEATAGTRAYTIGVAFPSLSGDPSELGPAFAVFQETAVKALRELGHEVRYLSQQEIMDAKSDCLSGLDGVILSAGLRSVHVYGPIRCSGLPVVVLQNTVQWNLPFHQVIPDISSGFYAALRHLKERGHQDIVIAECEGVHEHRERRELFKECVRDTGFGSDRVTIVGMPRMIGDWGRATGYRIGREILERKKPVAIMSVSDFLSFGIVDVVREARLEFGKDVDLISFDDLEGQGLMPFGDPVLSSITFPREGVAKRAVNLLVEQIEAGDDVYHTLRVPTDLVVRSSSGGTDNEEVPKS